MAAGLRTIAQRWLDKAVVLELGAGTGRITAHLAGVASRYLAAEYSPAMAGQLITRALPGVIPILGDAHHLFLEDGNLLEDGSVDVVIEHETLPLTDAPPKVIEDVWRVLRPGGLLVRVLVHPLGVDLGAHVEAVYRATAFDEGSAPLLTGKAPTRSSRTCSPARLGHSRAHPRDMATNTQHQ